MRKHRPIPITTTTTTSTRTTVRDEPSHELFHHRCTDAAGRDAVPSYTLQLS